MTRPLDVNDHREFFLDDFECLYGLNLLLCDVFYHGSKIIPDLTYAIRQYALGDPRWTLSRLENFISVKRPFIEYFRGSMTLLKLKKSDLVRFSYMKRAMPIASEATVMEFEQKHFEYFRIFPSSIDLRLYSKAYDIALKYSNRTRFPENLFSAPYLSGACQEFPRSLGGSAGYMNFLIRYYRLNPPFTGPYAEEIRLCIAILLKHGVDEISLVSLLTLSENIVTATNDLVLFICLRECNHYIQHARSCKHGSCEEKEKHPKVLSFAVAEHGKARGITINEACVSTLAAYVRPIGTFIMQQQPGFKMAFHGISSEEVNKIIETNFSDDFLMHSGDQIKATDNFPFALTFNIWRGFIDGCHLLSDIRKNQFKEISYMCLGPQLLLPSPRIRNEEERKIIKYRKAQRDLFLLKPIEYLKRKDASEFDLQNTLKAVFGYDFMFDFKVALANTLMFKLHAIRLNRKAPLITAKKIDFRRNHLVERGGQHIDSFEDLWRTFLKNIEESPQLILVEKAMMHLAKRQCSIIYDSQSPYLTRHGVLMSSPLSFPTLNFMNILGREISGAKLIQFFYGDDELSVGEKKEIDKFLTMMKKMGLIYSDDKDILSNRGGIFIEIPFSIDKNKISVIPVIKSKIYYPVDATYLDAFSTLKSSLSSSYVINNRASTELKLQFSKALNYLSSVGIPLDLPPALGGLDVDNPVYNDNTLLYLSKLPSIFECDPQETIKHLMDIRRCTARTSRFAERIQYTNMINGQLHELTSFKINYVGKGLPLLTTMENLSNQLYASQLFLGKFMRTEKLPSNYKYYALHLMGTILRLNFSAPRSSQELQAEYSNFRKNVCFTASDTSMQAIEKTNSRKLTSAFFT